MSIVCFHFDLIPKNHKSAKKFREIATFKLCLLHRFRRILDFPGTKGIVSIKYLVVGSFTDRKKEYESPVQSTRKKLEDYIIMIV